MKFGLVAVVCVGAVTVGACGSSGGRASSTTTPHPQGIECSALVGTSVDANAVCTTAITGKTTPTSFPCYDGSGDFYYINVDSKKYVYGLPGGEWKVAPFTQSLGPIAADLGC